MIFDFALWQQAGLFVVALLAFVYVFYFKIWVGLAIASDLLFALALAGCITSIVVAPAFDAGARWAVKASPLPEALSQADAKVAALESLPSELIARALAKVGYSPAPPDDPSHEEPGRIQSGVNATAEETPTEGPFASRIRPAVESLVAIILRGSTCIVSFILLLLALALRSSTATVRELRALGDRLGHLENTASENADAAKSMQPTPA